jgi:uncharacterized protein with GYD domain
MTELAILVQKESSMPTYVTLFRYSSEGFKHLNEEGRQQQIRRIEAHGGQVKDAYGLMGEWDVLFITEFPDEKSAMSALVTTCQSGMGTTQTMTALPWADFVQLGHPA